MFRSGRLQFPAQVQQEFVLLMSMEMVSWRLLLQPLMGMWSKYSFSLLQSAFRCCIHLHCRRVHSNTTESTAINFSQGYVDWYLCMEVIAVYQRPKIMLKMFYHKSVLILIWNEWLIPLLAYKPPVVITHHFKDFFFYLYKGLKVTLFYKDNW